MTNQLIKKKEGTSMGINTFLLSYLLIFSFQFYIYFFYISKIILFISIITATANSYPIRTGIFKRSLRFQVDNCTFLIIGNLNGLSTRLSASRFILNGTLITKVVPTLSSLSKEMLPPPRSATIEPTPKKAP